MSKKIKRIAAIATLILVLDHLSKWAIVVSLAIGDGVSIIPNIFDIVHVRNFGSAFGLFADQSPTARMIFFAISTLFALGFLGYYFFITPLSDRITFTALSMILGGALGNISDRLLRGSVVDFLHFHWYDAIWRPTLFSKTLIIPLSWPSFNVADIAITSGVFLLLVASVRNTKTA